MVDDHPKAVTVYEVGSYRYCDKLIHNIKFGTIPFNFFQIASLELTMLITLYFDT